MRSFILIAASLFALSAPAIAEVPPDVAGAPGTETWPDDDGLWVRRHLTVTLGADGRITTEVEEALKPFTGNPMREDMLDPRIDWNDLRSTLEVVEAVTWMVDGTEVRAQANSFVPNTAGELQWAVPYAKMRQLTVAHVGVEHGSTSLLHYRIADRGALGMPMWGQQTLADYIPIQDLLVRLEVPGSSELKVGMVDLAGMQAPGLQIYEEGTDEGRVYQVHGAGIAGLILNENHGDVGVPTLVWSTSPSWSHTRSYLEAQVEPSAMADGYVLAKLDGVLDGSVTKEERIARIHTFVVDGVRTIDWPALDFGYTTRSAPEVLSSSIGHPLDKAVLLVAMLRGAGFEAHVALASSHRAWLPDVPSPVPFEQVWVRVDAGHKPIWLDPTASQADHNGYHLAGKPVLVLDGEADAPTVVRELDPHHNHGQLRVQLDLTATDGALEASGRADLDLAGLYCPALGFDRSADHTDGVAGHVSGLFGGGEHSTVVARQTKGYLALGADFEGGSIAVPASGLVRIDLPRVPGAVNGAALESFRAARSLPIELDGRARELVVVELALPDGWEPTHLPDAVKIENNAGRVERSVVYDQDDGSVVIRTELEIAQPVVAAADWPDLRALLLEIESNTGGTVLLRATEQGE